MEWDHETQREAFKHTRIRKQARGDVQNNDRPTLEPSSEGMDGGRGPGEISIYKHRY